MATISTDASYSAGNYGNNTNFTVQSGAILTVNQSTSDIRYYRCTTFGEIIFSNDSTTIPRIFAMGSTGGASQLRAEQAGVVKTEGDWIVLGTGNGVVGQVFNVPLAEGVNGIGTQSCPDLGALFIDAGDTYRDGTPFHRLLKQVDQDAFDNCIDHEFGGNVFTQDLSNNTVTLKRAVSVGQEVKMPNIIFKTGSSFGGNFFSWDVNPNGVFDFSKCLWSGKFDFNCSSARSVKLKEVGLKTVEARILNVTSQIEGVDNESVVLSIEGNVANPYNVGASADGGRHRNIWIDSPANYGSFNVISATNTSDPYFEQIVVTSYNSGTVTPTGNYQRAALNSSSPNTKVYDLYSFSYHQPIQLTSGASNTIADNVVFRPSSRNDVAFLLDTGALRVTGSVENAVITNLRMLPNANTYVNHQAIQLTAGVKSLTISGVTVHSGPSGSVDNRLYILVSDNSNGTRINDVVVHGQLQHRIYSHGANSLNLNLTNIYFVDEQVDNATPCTVGARCRMEQVYLNEGNFGVGSVATGVDSLSVMGLRNTANGAVTKTDGLFVMRMSPTSEQTDYYSEVNKTGIIIFNNGNRLYMENSGDIIELESFTHNNVSSISSNLVKEGGGTGSFDVTVKMRRPDGVYTSYVATTQSAMQAAYATLSSDTQNRVQFKFRIEKTTTNLTDNLQGLRFETTLTGEDYPFVLDPGIVNITNGAVYSIDASTRFSVDSDTITTFTIDDITPKEIEVTGTGSVTVLGINNAKLTTTNITGTGTLVRGDGLNPSSNWSVASNVITLSSGTTETDLLGLRGLDIVDYSKVGDSYSYTINGRMEVLGSLTISPESEQLVFPEDQPTPQALLLPTNGTLTVGDTSSAPVYPKGTWLRVTRRGSNGWASSDNFSVRVTGGLINLYGGSISIASAFNFDDGTFNCLEQEIILLPSLHQNARFLARAATNFSNLDIYNNGIDISSAGAGATFDNILIYDAKTLGIHPCYDQMELVNYDYVVKGSIFPFASSDTSSKTIFARNFAKGTSGGYQTSLQFGDSTNLSHLVIELSKDLTFNFKNTSGANLEGVKLYSIERDNSGTNYSDWNQDNDNRAVTLNGVNYTTPLATNATSDVNGDITIDNFRFAIAYQRNTGVKEVSLCRFTKSADATDVHDFLFCSYNSLLSSTDIGLQQTGTKHTDWILVDDLVLSETNKATVDAYVELETPEKLYDYSKSYLYDNYAGESDTTFKRSGALLITGSYNVTFNSSYSVPLNIVSPTPDATIVKGTNVNLEAVSSNITIQDAAIHCEFTTGSDVTTGQIIWEAGGTSIGTVLAIQSGAFKIYVGSTGSEQSNTVAVSPNTKYSSTIVIDLTNDEIRFYLNTNSKKPTKSHLVDSVGFTESKWSGGNEVGVGENNNGVRSPFTGDFLGVIKNKSIYVYQTNEVSNTLDTIEVKSNKFIGNLQTDGKINLLNGATIEGSFTDYTGTTNIVNISVSVKDTLETPIQGATCLIVQQGINSISSITRSGTIVTVNSTSHGLSINDEVLIKGANENDYNGIKIVTNIIDSNQFQYSIASTPTTPATGTLTSQVIYLNSTTNSLGISSSTKNYIVDIPVNCFIRKATSSPFYKPFSQNSTLTSNGLDIKSVMIKDE